MEKNDTSERKFIVFWWLWQIIRCFLALGLPIISYFYFALEGQEYTSVNGSLGFLLGLILGMRLLLILDALFETWAALMLRRSASTRNEGGDGQSEERAP